MNARRGEQGSAGVPWTHSIWYRKNHKGLVSVVRHQLFLLCVFPACVLRSVPDGEEVDDPGGEIQSYVRLAVDHCDAVSVAVAGSGHAAAEQQERRPTCTDAKVKVGG